MYKSVQSSSLSQDDDPMNKLDNFIDESLLEKTWYYLSNEPLYKEQDIALSSKKPEGVKNYQSYNFNLVSGNITHHNYELVVGESYAADHQTKWKLEKNVMYVQVRGYIYVDTLIDDEIKKVTKKKYESAQHYFILELKPDRLILQRKGLKMYVENIIEK
eukprot:gene2628-3825_t